MDAFLADIFDVSGVELSPFLSPGNGGGLSHERLLSDPRLVTNAAFRFVWQRLSGGALPSSRCYVEFLMGVGHVRHTDAPQPDEILAWLLHGAGGSFSLLKDTEVIKTRAHSLLNDGSYVQHVRALQEHGSGVLHRSLVEKLIDRFHVPGSTVQAATFLTRSLLATYLALAGPTHRPATTSETVTNPLSGMLASHEEEMDEARKFGGLEASASGPKRVCLNDAVKRRMARDLHFTRRQYNKAYVTSPDSLMSYAEVVRIAVGSPWVVGERVAAAWEPHMLVLASSCIRLHSFSDGGAALRSPVPTIQGSNVSLESMLIVFDAGDAVTDAELIGLGAAAGFQRVFRARSLQLAGTENGSDEGPLLYPLYFADAYGAPGWSDWTYGILASTLRRHLMRGADQGAGAADLLTDRCITSVAMRRGILGGSRVFCVASAADAAQVILAVDTRQDPSATVLSIALALSSLQEPHTWAVRMMCSRANRHACERMLVPLLGSNVSICDWAPELNVPADAFDVETHYNELMKNASTWRGLLPATVVLTVQDDGLLMRYGLERLDDGRALHGRIPYLGAPWEDAPHNAPVKARAPSLVGNGGLSLRNVRAMLEICEAVPDVERKRIYHTRVELVPEDIMFACAAAQIPEARVVARDFSCEMIPHPFALGFHKPWPYWSVGDIRAHMEGLMADDRQSGRPGLRAQP